MTVSTWWTGDDSKSGKASCPLLLRISFVVADCLIDNIVQPLRSVKYNKSSFIFIDEYCSMNNAQQYCAKTGGRLVHVLKQDTQTFLDDTIARRYDYCKQGQDRRCSFWIGLMYKNGSFVWTNPAVSGQSANPGENPFVPSVLSVTIGCFAAGVLNRKNFKS